VADGGGKPITGVRQECRCKVCHRNSGKPSTELAGTETDVGIATVSVANSDLAEFCATREEFAHMTSSTKARNGGSTAPEAALGEGSGGIHRGSSQTALEMARSAAPFSKPVPEPTGTSLTKPQADSQARCSGDELVLELAGRQHGVVTRAQLLEAGVTERVVERHLTAKRLRPLLRGVYIMGPLVSLRAREMAAVLASGAEAVVSHRSAASLWDLLPPQTNADPVDVTVLNRGTNSRPGIRRHRVRRLDGDQTSSVDGIPVTTAARTLLDLSACVGARDLEQALAQAERRQSVTTIELFNLISRHPGRPGTPALRAILQRDGPPALARSEAEERFLALIRRAKLPTPEANVLFGGHELDFLWRSEGVAVEVDGYAFHSSKRRFERDRRRDARLAALGIQVIRLTWRQIVVEPHATLVWLAQTLVRASLR
jgi:very-short-patch-repair endonuclease